MSILMTDWHDFYLAVAGASAALSGLIFVGVSISLRKILSLAGLANRALLALLLLLTDLVLSLLFLVPGLPINALSICVLVIGVLNWLVIFRLDVQIVRTKQNQHQRQRLFNMAIDQLATVCLVISGIAMLASWSMSQYWIVPVILISISKAVLDGWALLVEINR